MEYHDRDLFWYVLAVTFSFSVLTSIIIEIESSDEVNNSLDLSSLSPKAHTFSLHLLISNICILALVVYGSLIR